MPSHIGACIASTWAHSSSPHRPLECAQYLTGRGNVILHVTAHADASIAKDERDKIINTLEAIGRLDRTKKDELHEGMHLALHPAALLEPSPPTLPASLGFLLILDVIPWHSEPSHLRDPWDLPSPPHLHPKSFLQP